MLDKILLGNPKWNQIKVDLPSCFFGVSRTPRTVWENVSMCSQTSRTPGAPSLFAQRSEHSPRASAELGIPHQAPTFPRSPDFCLRFSPPLPPPTVYGVVGASAGGEQAAEECLLSTGPGTTLGYIRSQVFVTKVVLLLCKCNSEDFRGVLKNSVQVWMIIKILTVAISGLRVWVLSYFLLYTFIF